MAPCSRNSEAHCAAHLRQSHALISFAMIIFMATDSVALKIVTHFMKIWRQARWSGVWILWLFWVYLASLENDINVVFASVLIFWWELAISQFSVDYRRRMCFSGIGMTWLIQCSCRRQSRTQFWCYRLFVGLYEERGYASVCHIYFCTHTNIKETYIKLNRFYAWYFFSLPQSRNRH